MLFEIKFYKDILSYASVPAKISFPLDCLFCRLLFLYKFYEKEKYNPFIGHLSNVLKIF